MTADTPCPFKRPGLCLCPRTRRLPPRSSPTGDRGVTPGHQEGPSVLRDPGTQRYWVLGVGYSVLGIGGASCAPPGVGDWPWGDEHCIDFPRFRVKEGGQTGTMARHNTSNGQKCCDDRFPFKSTVHKGYIFPCSTMMTQIVCRRARRPPLGTGQPQRPGYGLAGHGNVVQCRSKPKP